MKRQLSDQLVSLLLQQQRNSTIDDETPFYAMQGLVCRVEDTAPVMLRQNFESVVEPPAPKDNFMTLIWEIQHFKSIVDNKQSMDFYCHGYVFFMEIQLYSDQYCSDLHITVFLHDRSERNLDLYPEDFTVELVLPDNKKIEFCPLTEPEEEGYYTGSFHYDDVEEYETIKLVLKIDQSVLENSIMESAEWDNESDENKEEKKTEKKKENKTESKTENIGMVNKNGPLGLSPTLKAAMNKRPNLRELDKSNLEQLWATGHASDLEITCDDGLFKVHKGILAAGSQHFRELFESDAEEPIKAITIEDVGANDMQTFLHCIYTGDPGDLNRTSIKLLTLASRYRVPTLRRICETYLRLCCENFGVINGHVWAGHCWRTLSEMRYCVEELGMFAAV